MRYEADRAWLEDSPSRKPSGYKLRLSFDFVNTERGYDTVHLYDGDGGAPQRWPGQLGCRHAHVDLSPLHRGGCARR